MLCNRLPYIIHYLLTPAPNRDCMWPLGAILILASVAFSYPFPHLRRAEYVTSVSGSYDFVIAGGYVSLSLQCESFSNRNY